MLTDKVFELMKKTLEQGKPVKVLGFGKFEVRKKSSRNGAL